MPITLELRSFTRSSSSASPKRKGASNLPSFPLGSAHPLPPAPGAALPAWVVRALEAPGMDDAQVNRMDADELCVLGCALEHLRLCYSHDPSAVVPHAAAFAKHLGSRADNVRRDCLAFLRGALSRLSTVEDAACISLCVLPLARCLRDARADIASDAKIAFKRLPTVLLEQHKASLVPILQRILRKGGAEEGREGEEVGDERDLAWAYDQLKRLMSESELIDFAIPLLQGVQNGHVRHATVVALNHVLLTSSLAPHLDAFFSLLRDADLRIVQSAISLISGVLHHAETAQVVASLQATLTDQRTALYASFIHPWCYQMIARLTGPDHVVQTALSLLDGGDVSKVMALRILADLDDQALLEPHVIRFFTLTRHDSAAVSSAAQYLIAKLPNAMLHAQQSPLVSSLVQTIQQVDSTSQGKHAWCYAQLVRIKSEAFAIERAVQNLESFREERALSSVKALTTMVKNPLVADHAVRYIDLVQDVCAYLSPHSDAYHSRCWLYSLVKDLIAELPDDRLQAQRLPFAQRIARIIVNAERTLYPEPERILWLFSQLQRVARSPAELAQLDINLSELHSCIGRCDSRAIRFSMGAMMSVDVVEQKKSSACAVLTAAVLHQMSSVFGSSTNEGGVSSEPLQPQLTSSSHLQRWVGSVKRWMPRDAFQTQTTAITACITRVTEPPTGVMADRVVAALNMVGYLLPRANQDAYGMGSLSLLEASAAAPLLGHLGHLISWLQNGVDSLRGAAGKVLQHLGGEYRGFMSDDFNAYAGSFPTHLLTPEVLEPHTEILLQTFLVGEHSPSLSLSRAGLCLSLSRAMLQALPIEVLAPHVPTLMPLLATEQIDKAVCMSDAQRNKHCLVHHALRKLPEPQLTELAPSLVSLAKEHAQIERAAPPNTYSGGSGGDAKRRLHAFERTLGSLSKRVLEENADAIIEIGLRQPIEQLPVEALQRHVPALIATGSALHLLPSDSLDLHALLLIRRNKDRTLTLGATEAVKLATARLSVDTLAKHAEELIRCSGGSSGYAGSHPAVAKLPVEVLAEHVPALIEVHDERALRRLPEPTLSAHLPVLLSNSDSYTLTPSQSQIMRRLCTDVLAAADSATLQTHAQILVDIIKPCQVVRACESIAGTGLVQLTRLPLLKEAWHSDLAPVLIRTWLSFWLHSDDQHSEPRLRAAIEELIDKLLPSAIEQNVGLVLQHLLTFAPDARARAASASLDLSSIPETPQVRSISSARVTKRMVRCIALLRRVPASLHAHSVLLVWLLGELTGKPQEDLERIIRNFPLTVLTASPLVFTNARRMVRSDVLIRRKYGLRLVLRLVQGAPAALELQRELATHEQEPSAPNARMLVDLLDHEVAKSARGLDEKHEVFQLGQRLSKELWKPAGVMGEAAKAEFEEQFGGSAL